MPWTYAIADMHGRFDLLEEAIQAIFERDFDLGMPGGRVIFLGDYIDRGPQSKQIIELLMRGSDFDHIAWTCIAGNHEAMMLQCLERRQDMPWWARNGGTQTLMSYGATDGMLLRAAADLVPAHHIEWVKSLPLYFEDEHRIFVHAGVEVDVPMEKQSAETLQWHNYRDSDPRGLGSKHVVHGHDRRADGPLLLRGRTNLDTAAWRYGRLVIGVFEDEKPGGPVDLIEIRGPDIETLIPTLGR